MNKVCRVVGICDILVGIIDLMSGEIIKWKKKIGWNV